jgi:hypothetical protein
LATCRGVGIALQTPGRSVTLRDAAWSGAGGSGTSRRGTVNVDQQTQLLALAISVAVGILALILILGRQRREREEATGESPFATSTEGEKRCPKCGMGNLWTDTRCISCGTKLRG